MNIFSLRISGIQHPVSSLFLTLLLIAGILFISCKNSTSGQNDSKEKITAKSDSSLVYKSDNLIIERLSNHTYQHTSFLSTKDFGKVACNGMIVVNETEAVVFDTPADNESSSELINYVANNLKAKINAIIPTHFHADCVGGLEKFKENNIPSYASNRTIALLKIKDNQIHEYINGFDDSFLLSIGDKKVYCEYFGEGHTKDNIIAYFPDDNVVFGGCLIKELNANKGNLEDANVKEWATTVGKLKQKYPQLRIVIPGHGKRGGTELFDYTIKLFE
jgi:metallo-beta-lactamase class B